MVGIKWLILVIFTISYVVGMIIHLSKEGFSGSYTGRGKSKGELGMWGMVLTLGYFIFLAIYGGVYWW